MKNHPAAEIFPMMDSQSLSDLADDIRAHGQREWIVLWKGQILDGRNRYRACQLAGVEPTLSEIEDDDLDPIAYVLSANLHRRHLDESQRSMVAGRIKKLLEPAAKERQRQSKGRGKKGGANLPTVKTRASDDAATALNVSRKSVDAASTVIAHGSPELVAAVDRGEVAVSKAAKVAKTVEKDKQVDAARDKPFNRPEVKAAFRKLCQQVAERAGVAL